MAEVDERVSPRTALIAKAWWEDAHGVVVLLSDATDAVQGAIALDRAALVAAVQQNFETLRGELVRHPTEGGDSIDAYIGSRLNEAERALLRLLAGEKGDGE